MKLRVEYLMRARYSLADDDARHALDRDVLVVEHMSVPVAPCPTQAWMHSEKAAFRFACIPQYEQRVQALESRGIP